MTLTGSCVVVSSSRADSIFRWIMYSFRGVPVSFLNTREM